MIKFRNVIFDFNEAGVYEELNHEFGCGVFYINGANGSGKTSFVRALTNNFSDYTGNIYIDDINVRDIDLSSGKIISCAFQNNEHLLLNSSINANINFINPSLDIELFKKYAKKFNLNIKMKKKFRKYSGGEQQKIKLILTLLSDSSILIFDEPENNLDTASITIFYELLNNIVYEKTIFVITHREKKGTNTLEFSNQRINIDTDSLDTSSYKPNNSEVIKRKFIPILYNEQPMYKIILIFLTTFSLFLLFILFSSFSHEVEQYTSRYSDDIASKYSDTELYMQAPYYNTFLPEDLQTQVVNDSDRLYFTTEDLETIEELEGVVDVYPVTYIDGVNTSRVEDEYVLYDSVNYEISNSNFEEEELLRTLSLRNEGAENLEAGYILYPKDFYDGFPDDLIFGEMPDDYSNEIVISVEFAKQIAYENGLSSIESVVGMTIELGLIDADEACNGCIYENTIDEPTETRVYTISGITSIGTDVNFAYGMLPERLQVERYPWEHISEDTYKIIYDEYVMECEVYGYEALSYEEFITHNPDLISGFRITFETPEDLEKFYHEVTNINPYLYMESKYLYENGAPKSYYSEWVTKSIIYFIIIITIIIALLVFVAQINKNANKKFINKMKLNGYTVEQRNKVKMQDFIIITGVSVFLNIPILLMSISSLYMFLFNIIFIIVTVLILFLSRGRNESR